MGFQKGQSGNPAGRPKGQETLKTEFIKAIKNVEKSKRKNLIEYYIEQAFKDNSVLKDLMGKIVPDLSMIKQEISGDSGFQLIIKSPEIKKPENQAENKVFDVENRMQKIEEKN